MELYRSTCFATDVNQQETFENCAIWCPNTWLAENFDKISSPVYALERL